MEKQTVFTAEVSKQGVEILRDIIACLRGIGTTPDANVALAAYWLYGLCSTEEIENEVSEDCRKLDAEIQSAVRSRLGVCERRALSGLAAKYEPNAFASAALDFDLSLVDKNAGTTPKSVVKLAFEALNVKAGEKIADFCCGCGGFLRFAATNRPDARFYGCELNADFALVAKIRARLLGENVRVETRSLFDSNDGDAGEFDKVFSNFPFGLRARDLLDEQFFLRTRVKFPALPRIVSGDWAFNVVLCNALGEGGKAVGIATVGSVRNGADRAIREYFAKRGLIEAVVALPEKLFGHTNVATYAIVFSRNNKSIRLVDATPFCCRGRRYNEFDDEGVRRVVEALSVDGENSRLVEFDKLAAEDFDFDLSRYRNDGPKFREAVPFGTLVKSVSRGALCSAKELDETISQDPTPFRFLPTSSVGDGIIDADLPFLKQIDSKYDRCCPKNGNLVISKIGAPYKAAVVEAAEGERILANGNLYIIELDESKVEPEYLAAFFNGSVGAAVLASVAVGTAVSSLGVDKLKKVRVPCPSLKKQREIVKKYREAREEIVASRLRIEEATARIAALFDRDVEPSIYARR